MRRSRVYSALLLCCALMLFASSAAFTGSPAALLKVQQVAAATAWAPNTYYAVNAQVSYGGRLYQCRQAHTSQTGWEPPNVPALWLDIGADTGTNPTATRTRTATTAGGATATRTRTRTSTTMGGATATRTRTRTSTTMGGATATRTRTRTATTAGVATRTTTTGPSTGLRKHILVGYWHNFDNGSGFIRLRDVSPNWDVINVSFAEPTTPTSGDVRFDLYTATGYTVDQFKADIAYLKSQGKKVLISIGGAEGQVSLDSTGARDMFVSTVSNIITTYGFDGLDVDFEGHSLYLNQNDTNPNAPTTSVVVNLISALRSIKARFGSSFMLTMAPETFFVQLGYSFYGGTCLSCDRRAGAYLPVIIAMRNDLNWLQVQNYNSGPIVGLDGQYHSMGGSDFHIAMLDMLLAGFPIAGTGTTFAPLRPDQVVLGVPATGSAGNGYVSEAQVQAAIDCLVRGTSCGSYTPRSNRANNGPFRGIMSWSINWDKFAGLTFSSSHRAYLNNLP